MVVSVAHTYAYAQRIRPRQLLKLTMCFFYNIYILNNMEFLQKSSSMVKLDVYIFPDHHTSTSTNGWYCCYSGVVLLANARRSINSLDMCVRYDWRVWFMLLLLNPNAPIAQFTHVSHTRTTLCIGLFLHKYNTAVTSLKHKISQSQGEAHDTYWSLVDNRLPSAD